MMQFKQRPHINWGSLPSPRRRRNWCGLCQRQARELFDVPDDVWLHYVGVEQRHQIVCLRCWHWLVSVIDGGAYQAQHGVPVALWSDVWRERHGVALRPPGAIGCVTLPANRMMAKYGMVIGCRLCDRKLATEADVYEIDLDRPGEANHGPFCLRCAQTAEGKPFSQWLDEQHRLYELCRENRAAAAAAS